MYFTIISSDDTVEYLALTMDIGLAGAYAWMRDRHNEKPIVPGCSIVPLSAESLQGGAENLLVGGLIGNLLALFGVNLGPKNR
jgi:hypothetical protein